MGTEIRKRVLSSEDVEKQLQTFEARYGMSSKDFYVKFNRGELGDQRDYLKWASLYDISARTRMRKSVNAGCCSSRTPPLAAS